jgi:hypothetical protein
MDKKKPLPTKKDAYEMGKRKSAIKRNDDSFKSAMERKKKKQKKKNSYGTRGSTKLLPSSNKPIIKIPTKG